MRVLRLPLLGKGRVHYVGRPGSQARLQYLLTVYKSGPVPQRQGEQHALSRTCLYQNMFMLLP